MTRQQLVRIAPFWILLVAVGSLMPEAAKRALGTNASVLWHQCYHFASFGSAALILSLIAPTAPKRVAAFLSVVALGLLLESLQHAIWHNPMEWWDVRDDALAAAAAWALANSAAVRRVLLQG